MVDVSSAPAGDVSSGDSLEAAKMGQHAIGRAWL